MQCTERKKQPQTSCMVERGPTIKNEEEKLIHWANHFEGVLNVKSTVGKEVVDNVESHFASDTTEVMREEVEVVQFNLDYLNSGLSEHSII